MLFIYNALHLGGVETFFVRMAKERSKIGRYTALLLLSKPQKSDPELLEEIRKYAHVLFLDDIIKYTPIISRKLPLVAPINKKSVEQLMEKSDQIHAFYGRHALLGYRLSQLINKDIPITIGLYHYIVYVWGGNKIAHHERVNRDFVFQYLHRESLIFFSEGNRNYYENHKKLDFSGSNTFRLGVVNTKKVELKSKLKNPLKICAVGRLVEFKTYNFYMLEVVENLLKKGIEVVFDIYGDGPLKTKLEQDIAKKGLEKYVHLKGNLDYSKFDATVSEYDLFIGSGTAIIQASGLGIPSIAAIENMDTPKTYGFFNDAHQYEYNLKGLDVPLIDIQNLIEEYFYMNDSDRLNLKNDHLRAIENFTNKSCQENMDALKTINMPPHPFKFNRWLYEISRVIDHISIKLNKKHPYNTRHKDIK